MIVLHFIWFWFVTVKLIVKKSSFFRCFPSALHTLALFVYLPLFQIQCLHQTCPKVNGLRPQKASACECSLVDRFYLGWKRKKKCSKSIWIDSTVNFLSLTTCCIVITNQYKFLSFFVFIHIFTCKRTSNVMPIWTENSVISHFGIGSFELGGWLKIGKLHIRDEIKMVFTIVKNHKIFSLHSDQLANTFSHISLFSAEFCCNLGFCVAEINMHRLSSLCIGFNAKE